MATSKNTTTINIENIPCYCSIGIHDEEKKMGQRLLVCVSIDIDSSKVIHSDDVKDTLSYVDVYSQIQTICKSKSYSLIEVLADDIACTLLKNPLALKVKLCICKPHIPFRDFQGNVSVEIERTK